MYVISQLDINLMFTNKFEFRKRLIENIKISKLIDIENFRSMKALRILVIDILLPEMANHISPIYSSPVKIQFCNKKLKLLLDKLIKKHYIQAKYEGINNRTRTYVIYG